MRNYLLLFLSSVIIKNIKGAKQDIPCEWKSLTGAHYDLKPLILKSDASPYSIIDGDIPCTPETEPSFSYQWNFCSSVGSSFIPDVCKSKGISDAVALQYAIYPGYSDCYVIGKYDPTNDDLSYTLLDEKDPTKGVSMKYALGEKCKSVDRLRSVSIDLLCADVPMKIISAQEPSKCQYHMVVESYHGCPTECPITENGLCNSHGHCAYDPVNRLPYCYCNKGYSGPSCKKDSSSSSSESSSSSGYDGYTIQLTLLIVLVIITIGLVGVIGFMIYKVTNLRQQQADDYTALAGGAAEMTRHRF
mmetsp:Transcript_12579/g.12991  ORF Transcript_12579/g.12991 Transcript_12579/m.12991 type:complete len:303 (-) Transcript_12579:544-1452(-)